MNRMKWNGMNEGMKEGSKEGRKAGRKDSWNDRTTDWSGAELHEMIWNGIDEWMNEQLIATNEMTSEREATKIVCVACAG